MVELVLINGEACVKKSVKNVEVYNTLAKSSIAGVPEIIKIESGVVYYKYVNGETLKNRLENIDDISKEFVRFLIFSCITIISNIHQYDIVHNDITPENIIITPKGKIYIIDFESASFEGQKANSVVEKTAYSSPEILNDEITTFQSDIYSLGKILETLDEKKQYNKIVNKCLSDNRYTTFRAMLHEVNAMYSMIEDEEEDFNWTDCYSKKTLVVIVVAVIVGALLGYFLSFSAKSSSTIMYIFFSIYAALATVDIFDYLRVIMFEEKRSKKIISKKLALSFAMFFVTVSISIILMKII